VLLGHRLRHYATSRKVVGSIPDEIIGFFDWPNPCSRTIGLGSTQPLTEISNPESSWGEVTGGRRVRLTILPPSVSRLSTENVGTSTSHKPMNLHGQLHG
jgi:hypothetical protein